MYWITSQHEVMWDYIVFIPPLEGNAFQFFLWGLGGLDGNPFLSAYKVLIFVFGGEISCFLETETINFNSRLLLFKSKNV